MQRNANLMPSPPSESCATPTCHPARLPQHTSPPPAHPQHTSPPPAHPQHTSTPAHQHTSTHPAQPTPRSCPARQPPALGAAWDLPCPAVGSCPLPKLELLAGAVGKEGRSEMEGRGRGQTVFQEGSPGLDPGMRHAYVRGAHAPHHTCTSTVQLNSDCRDRCPATATATASPCPPLWSPLIPSRPTCELPPPRQRGPERQKAKREAKPTELARRLGCPTLQISH
ncbi:hypothetical protein B0H67DRAFT_93870 [Lasiosphaeris hirsuta]|uniref:Uncharacterized protein n=1 Tax=Lasiosphaeris hirsuta TaxID=260670 RepID=A0AA40BDW2_9PEZI|nr:hypothetical protein B0H67DRAFT_93870 [Lasiosphaeris hirsuta]